MNCANAKCGSSYSQINFMQLPAVFKDARYFQIIFQSIFLLYGLFFLHWPNEGWLYATYFITSLFAQLFCESVFGKKDVSLWQRFKKGVPSVLISSFGLSLLLKTNEIQVAIFAAAVSIISKYLIRINGKHIFNPSALGIVAAVLLTDKAWISPGQWGSGAVIVFAVLCFGFVVTTRVQKLDVSLSFLGMFLALLFTRQVIYLGWPLDYFIQSASTGSLLLFSFFMITDPRTTPDHGIARMAWSACIAIAAFYLATFKFMNGAPVFVLVAAQPLVPILDWFFKARKFEWSSPQNITAQEKEFLHTIYTRSVM